MVIQWSIDETIDCTVVTQSIHQHLINCIDITDNPAVYWDNWLHWARSFATLSSDQMYCRQLTAAISNSLHARCGRSVCSLLTRAQKCLSRSHLCYKVQTRRYLANIVLRSWILKLQPCTAGKPVDVKRWKWLQLFIIVLFIKDRYYTIIRIRSKRAPHS